MTPGTTCTFCGRELRAYATDGRVRLCVPCERIPRALRERLAALLVELREAGCQAFIRVEVSEEADDG